MSKYIPVEPEKWAAMVRAWADNSRLQAEVERLTAFTTRTIIPNEELQAENARLKAEVAIQNERINRRDMDVGQLYCENARLKAEVERLTKAGDAMVDMVDWEVPYERRKNLEADWNAAKEGKQP
jgi:predicted nuclease with TOPRIM domain